MKRKKSAVAAQTVTETSNSPNPAPSTGASSEKKAAEGAPPTSLQTLGKWVNRALAATLWLGALAHLSGKAPLGSWVPASIWALPLSPIVLLSLVAYAFWFGPLKFAGLLLYVGGFPLVGIYVVLSTAWGVMKLQWKFLRWLFGLPGRIRQSRTVVLWLSVAPVLTVFLVSVVTDPPWLRLLEVLLVVEMLVLTGWVSFVVVSPITVLTRIAERIMGWVIRMADEAVCGDIPKTGPLTPDKKKSLLETRPGLGELTEWVERVERQLLTPRMAVGVFLSLFLALFAMTVLAFGGAYWAEWKADSRSFAALSGNASLGETVFFSLSTITTAGVSDLRAATPTAKVLVSGEIIFAVSLFTLLALSFSTLHAADLESAKATWAGTRERVSTQIARYQRFLHAVERTIDDGGLPSLQSAFETSTAEKELERWEKAIRMIRPAYLDEPRGISGAPSAAGLLQANAGTGGPSQ